MKYDAGFIPQKDVATIKVPTTLDYKGGRTERNKNKTIWTAVIWVMIIVITVGMIIRGEGSLLNRLFTSFIFFVVTSLITRFGFMGEAKIRNQMIAREDAGAEISTRCFWGITKIGTDEPYICTFPQGKQGIFIRMERGVFKGDIQSSKHRHRESISAFFNKMGEDDNITVTHIDLMDYVGTDKRIDRAKNSIRFTKNDPLKKEIQGIYTNVKSVSKMMVFTSDIFLFQWEGSTKLSMDKIMDGLQILLSGGGYIGYEYLNTTELREMYKTLFNIKEFSVTEAERNVLNGVTDGIWSVKPIRALYDNGGVYKYNQTMNEKRELREYETAHKQAMKMRRKDPDYKTSYLGVERPVIMQEGYNGPINNLKIDNDNTGEDEDTFSFE